MRGAWSVKGLYNCALVVHAQQKINNCKGTQHCPDKRTLVEYFRLTTTYYWTEGRLIKPLLCLIAKRFWVRIPVQGLCGVLPVSAWIPASSHRPKAHKLGESVTFVGMSCEELVPSPIVIWDRLQPPCDPA